MLVEEMTVEDCRKAMSSAVLGRLASVQDGQPYVVPVSFAVDGDYAYLFSMPGQKVDWMRKNPRVCLGSRQREQSEQLDEHRRLGSVRGATGHAGRAARAAARSRALAEPPHVVGARRGGWRTRSSATSRRSSTASTWST